VESTAEFAHLVTNLYGPYISTNKFLARLSSRTTRGIERTRTWTLSPKFYTQYILPHEVSIHSEGFMEQTAVRGDYKDESDPRVVERWVEATNGPVRVDITELTAIEDANRTAAFFGQPPSRRGRPAGEFFPYSVANNPYADCEDLQAILAKIQIYPQIDPNEALPANYHTPCIVNALSVLGMPSQQLANMKPLIKEGRVSCQSLSVLCKRLGVHLAVAMGTEPSAKKVNHYGDTSAEKVYRVCLTATPG
jgi:hypothetical protein